MNKIKFFKKIENGWDSYNAEKPSVVAIHIAENILLKLKNNSIILKEIVPFSDGGINIIIEFIQNAFEFDIYNDGEIVFKQFNKNEENAKYSDISEDKINEIFELYIIYAKKNYQTPIDQAGIKLGKIK